MILVRPKLKCNLSEGGSYRGPTKVGFIIPEFFEFEKTGFLRYAEIMNIPQEIKSILEKLNEAGFEAYVVGGAARDLIMERLPKDWDVATNAKPEEIQKIFPESFYENKFGTVSVKVQSAKCKVQSEEEKSEIDKKQNQAIEFVEITTFRTDEKYTDKRHPDSVNFAKTIEEDLARRDFTVNAMALSLNANRKSQIANQGLKNERLATGDERLAIIDPFGGQEDLKKKVIRAVGEADERFQEDALRLMRAARFTMELDFEIEQKTKEAIQRNSGSLRFIAKERLRDEFKKILMTPRASEGILLLRELGLLEFVIPELEKGFGVAQNRHHIYTIFEHGVFSLKFAAEKKYNLIVRLAALLHDIAKPEAKRGEGPDATFYNHDILGARAAARILERLRFSRQEIEEVANLVRHHMFVYDVGAVSEAGVRRLLRRAGPENMKNLLALRVADRLGSGVPKAQPYRLRHFQYMVEKVQKDPISVKMLKINGHDLMEILKIEPGPKIGAILDVLLAEAIEEPKKNKKELLEKRAKELAEIDLAKLRELAKERIEEKKEEDDQIIKGKYWVK